jgi:hypothetical protein
MNAHNLKTETRATTMNQQRRMFRGRGGPSDSQLPKHNARQRKVPTQDSDRVRVNKYAADDERKRLEEQADAILRAAVVPNDGDNADDDLESTSSSEHDISDQANAEKVPSSDSFPSKKEMQHLLHRVRNVRESMQLSATNLGNPSTYENNVLHAVTNCITEWRAILRFYPEDEIENPRTVGLQIYEMIQQSLQCGPLAGGKPGYFKRCGVDLAKVVLTFLQGNVANKDDALVLYMSEKQADAIEKWKVSATKAIENDKPPSKSVVKKQETADRSGAKKQNKTNKKLKKKGFI